MSPFKSKAQSDWAETPEGKAALGGEEKVAEWRANTDYTKLPQHVSDVPKPRKRASVKAAAQIAKKRTAISSRKSEKKR